MYIMKLHQYVSIWSWIHPKNGANQSHVVVNRSGAMAEEDEYVAGTIATIGSLITKPKMTEKYLKKPPFRRGGFLEFDDFWNLKWEILMIFEKQIIYKRATSIASVNYRRVNCFCFGKFIEINGSKRGAFEQCDRWHRRGHSWLR